MKTYVTHAWMPIVTDHVAWTVINMFGRLLSDVERDVNVIDQSTIADIDDISESRLVVFVTKRMTDHVRNAVIAAAEVWAVFEDPNWPAVFDVEREYTMITWFKTLDCMPANVAWMMLKELAPLLTVTCPTRHVYLPLTSAAIEDTAYMTMLSDPHNTEMALSHMPDEPYRMHMAYIGSLKSCRAVSFAEMINLGCDFYGNFTVSDLASAANVSLSSVPKSSCRGRVSPRCVVALYQQYETVAYCPDTATVLLDTDTLRLVELAIAGADVRIFDSDQHVAAKLRCRLSMIVDDRLHASVTRLIDNSDALGFKARLHMLVFDS